MAKIIVVAGKDCSFETTQVQGTLMNEELINYLISHREDRPKYVIWDFQETDFSRFDVSHIRHAPSKLSNVIEEDERHALVFRGDCGFGIGRMMEAYFDVEHRIGVKAFREMADAKKWLSSNELNQKAPEFQYFRNML